MFFDCCLHVFFCLTLNKHVFVMNIIRFIKISTFAGYLCVQGYPCVVSNPKPQTMHSLLKLIRFT